MVFLGVPERDGGGGRVAMELDFKKQLRQLM